MTLANFTLTEETYFVAMQYYGLVMNRTYLILFGEKSLIGIKGNGLVSASGGGDPITLMITEAISVKGNLNDPFSYLKSSYIDKVRHLELEGEALQAQHRANFRIPYDQIISVNHDPKKKWGMGYYPHDGKVYVKTADYRKYEFIILGSQSGKSICNRIMKIKEQCNSLK